MLIKHGHNGCIHEIIESEIKKKIHLNKLKRDSEIISNLDLNTVNVLYLAEYDF